MTSFGSASGGSVYQVKSNGDKKWYKCNATYSKSIEIMARTKSTARKSTGGKCATADCVNKSLSTSRRQAKIFPIISCGIYSTPQNNLLKNLN